LSGSEGQLVYRHIVNTTSEYHPMHLQGHVLTVISQSRGSRHRVAPIHLDSALVGPRQTMDPALAANNPGVWTFHCHVLLQR
jgi:FtsP/CotA-like multicopper oxidase with cupredoxin domain